MKIDVFFTLVKVNIDNFADNLCILISDAIHFNQIRQK